MCNPNASKNEFTSDNPDKSQDCYPCMCPSCPGFHECGYIYKNMKHGETYECSVCGQIVKYMPFTEEFIEDHVSMFDSESFKAKLRNNFTRSMESGRGGYYETIRPRTDKMTS